MRPVTIGPTPGSFAAYRDAFAPMIARIGEFCSYCERSITANLAIEHIVSRDQDPGLALVWENFLLGCTNCNSTKLNKPVRVPDFLWPHLDNTQLAFEYRVGGFVAVHPGLEALSPGLAAKARAMLDLVGLDRHPGNPVRPPTAADRRWIQREEVWSLASRLKREMSLDDSGFVRSLIVEIALGNGFFSVWFSVFEGDADMRLRLIAAFRGTAGDCFSPEGNPEPRPGGQI